MNRNGSWLAGLLCVVAVALSVAWNAKADAADEITRLAALMEWKPGTVVADIGAGDGSYTFAAVQHVGSSGKVFATEIDPKKLDQLRSEVKRRGLQNVIVVDSKEADTNLPASCCDAIFLRRVYHHLIKPAEFDANIVRSLKPGGRLAIIDFPPRAGNWHRAPVSKHLGALLHPPLGDDASRLPMVGRLRVRTSEALQLTL
jgi:ubiquinone/menaquinone biosynthesis C-methylase UbiE